MPNSGTASTDEAPWPTALMRGDLGLALSQSLGRAARGKAASTALGLVSRTTRPLRVSSAQLWDQ